jgi:hypothetical protein
VFFLEYEDKADCTDFRDPLRELPAMDQTETQCNEQITHSAPCPVCKSTSCSDVSPDTFTMHLPGPAFMMALLHWVAGSPFISDSLIYSSVDVWDYRAKT